MTADFDSQVLRITDDGVLIEVRFSIREIIDESVIQSIGQELHSLIADRKQPRLLMNFADVRHLSSSALGVLIDLEAAVQERRGRLVLTEIADSIREVFKITKLDRTFDIQAIASDARADLR